MIGFVEKAKYQRIHHAFEHLQITCAASCASRAAEEIFAGALGVRRQISAEEVLSKEQFEVVALRQSGVNFPCKLFQSVPLTLNIVCMITICIFPHNAFANFGLFLDCLDVSVGLFQRSFSASILHSHTHGESSFLSASFSPTFSLPGRGSAVPARGPSWLWLRSQSI